MLRLRSSAWGSSTTMNSRVRKAPLGTYNRRLPERTTVYLRASAA